MKTCVKKLFLLTTIIFAPHVVQAESLCSYNEQAEINTIVSNVKANYEAVDIYAGKTLDIDKQDENGNIPEIDHYIKGFNINVLNITEDIYVKIKNDLDENVATFKYSDLKEGIATLQVKETTKLVTYTIEVYSNKYACAGEIFRKISLTTPIYNEYANLAACKENPDFYYCQEYISSNKITVNEFLNKLEEYKAQKEQESIEEEQKNNFWYKIKKIYEENKITIYAIGMIFVVMGVTTTVILIKKKRSRVL